MPTVHFNAQQHKQDDDVGYDGNRNLSFDTTPIKEEIDDEHKNAIPIEHSTPRADADTESLNSDASAGSLRSSKRWFHDVKARMKAKIDERRRMAANSASTDESEGEMSDSSSDAIGAEIIISKPKDRSDDSQSNSSRRSGGGMGGTLTAGRRLSAPPNKVMSDSKCLKMRKLF